MAEVDSTAGPNWGAWIEEWAGRVAERAERELAALVDVSSPSGDREAAEAVVAVAAALLPDEVELERPRCSSPGYAPDLLARLPGSGAGRLLLLGHLDTVIAHEHHHPLRREGDLLRGPGTVDMKGGVALSLGVLRALAAVRERFAQVSLLLVVDEEWRAAPFVHAERFAAYDACLCFEGGELTAEGHDGVVGSRKAAGTIRIGATGAAAHSGSHPDRGRNALLALATVATKLAERHDPGGAERITVVPTVLRSGGAFNVVPGAGELIVDVRAADLDAIERLLDAVPSAVDGVDLDVEIVRRWPSMDAIDRARAPVNRASELLGRPLALAERGGASDASHLAAGADLLTIDGLGPIGAGAHAPDEHIVAASLRPRAEVALALAAAVLGA